MAYSLSRLQRLYIKTQTDFKTAATLSGANACRLIKATFNNRVGLVTRKDKTGSRTATTGVAGRAYMQFSIEKTVAPNGTAGQKPDDDPIYQSAFGGPGAAVGGAPTFAIVSSTNAGPIVLTTAAHGYTVGTYTPLFVSGHTTNTAANGAWLAFVTSTTTLTLTGSTGNGVGGATGTVNSNCYQYTLQEPDFVHFTAGNYRSPSSLAQEVAIGCTVSNLEWQFGGNDGCMFTADGEGLYAIDSFYFSTATADRLGGLVSFPTEPGSPVTNGGIFAGFTGRIVINGATVTTIRTATVKYGTATEVIKDLFGSFVPDSAEADDRDVNVAIIMYDADDTATQALIIAAQTKIPVDVILQGGTVQGNTLFIRLHNVQFETSQLDDGQRRFVRTLPASRAFGTPNVGLDEITVWFA